MQPIVWHRLEADEALRRLKSSVTGLGVADAQKRLSDYGLNSLPEKRHHSLLTMLLGQFSDFMIPE